MRFAALALVSAVLTWAVPHVFARDNGQYAQADPAIGKWFRDQKNPVTGVHCCSEADGEYAEEDIRDGRYWTRWPRGDGKWHEVPKAAVINDPNRNGAPVVWWYMENGVTMIRCFAPGPKL